MQKDEYVVDVRWEENVYEGDDKVDSLEQRQEFEIKAPSPFRAQQRVKNRIENGVVISTKAQNHQTYDRTIESEIVSMNVERLEASLVNEQEETDTRNF